MSTNEQSSATPVKPMGWMVGVGVLMITLGVVVGLVCIAIIAKRKQQYRIQQPAEATPTVPRPGP